MARNNTRSVFSAVLNGNRGNITLPPGERPGQAGGALFSFSQPTALLNTSLRKLEAIRLFTENLSDNYAPLREMGAQIKGIIVKRTLRGRDIEGNQFAPLSTKRSAPTPIRLFTFKKDRLGKDRFFHGKPLIASVQTKKPKNGGSFALRKGSSYAERKAAMIKQAQHISTHNKKGFLGATAVKPIPTGSVAPPKANLYLSGSLLRNIRSWGSGKRGNLKITVGVSRNKALAAVLQGGRSNMPARPFIGLSNNEHKLVTDRFVRQFKTGISKEILRTRRL